MGILIEGQWHDHWYDTSKSEGRFERDAARFRNHISAGARFAPEAGRYRLYVSLACPWAHRTLIFRSLKQLGALIPVTVVKPLMLEHGWEFDEEPLYGLRFLHQLYTRAEGRYSGRVTVPVLWDTHEETIVSNESSEIIRMFNSAFDALTRNSDDYYPVDLRSSIDAINERIYHGLNNGVYRAGFATTQAAYEQAFHEVFATLDWMESTLREQRFLAGERLTEADWRALTTLVRFDAVYHGHFKCNRHKLSEFTALSRYLSELYWYPGIAGTVDWTHIKQHYYGSHRSINPSGVVPLGPVLPPVRANADSGGRAKPG